MKRRRDHSPPPSDALWDYLALAFALMNGEGVVEMVYHLIREFGEQVAENPLFGAVSEDFINAL